MSWRKVKKNHWLEASPFLILCNNNETFLDLIVTCEEKRTLYDNQWWPAQWLDQEEAPKHLPLKLAPKNVHGHYSVVCCRSDPLQLSESQETITSKKYAQQINEMHQKLQLALVNRKGSILHDNTQQHIAQPMLQKLNKLGYNVLPHLHIHLISCQPNYYFFKHLDNFLQGKHFYNQQWAENAFQEFIESKSMGFYATGINKLISHCENYVDCNGFILINGDVFEPSFNDLKFMVQNGNYFCTNLMVQLMTRIMWRLAEKIFYNCLQLKIQRKNYNEMSKRGRDRV